jgi:hypothetical protein
LIKGRNFISFAEEIIFLVKANPFLGLYATIFSFLDKSVWILRKDLLR